MIAIKTYKNIYSYYKKSFNKNELHKVKVVMDITLQPSHRKVGFYKQNRWDDRYFNKNLDKIIIITELF